METRCPFCTPSEYEERLVGSIGSFNVIATLGQITDGGHLLLVPRSHPICLGALENTAELGMSASRLCALLAKEYNTSNVTYFEHGMVGQTVPHAHLHVVPANVALDIGKRVHRDFPTCLVEGFVDFRSFHFAYALEQKPYLLWKESNESLSVCWNPPSSPQYFRNMVAEVLGRPERANWRNMDAKLDRKLYLETVQRLKKYFPSGG